MNKVPLATLLGLLAAAICLSFFAQADEVAPDEIVFVNVTLIPMDMQRTVEAQNVVIRGGRITAIGPTGELTPSAEAMKIDGSGKYLLPGLAEMHGHVPRPEQSMQYTEDVLFLYVANGVTTVRGMLGAPGQLTLRDRAASGSIVAPTLYLAGPSFSGNSIHSVKQAVELVRQQKAEGWNLLKIHPGLSLEQYDAIANTARAEDMRFGGHVPAEVGLMHALDAGQESFDHIDGYVDFVTAKGMGVNNDALGNAVKRTKDAGAWIVPTMALWETLYGAIELDTLREYDELRYMPPEIVASWVDRTERLLSSPEYDSAGVQRLIDTRMLILRALHEGGARILMGTDAPQVFSVPGFSLHRELQRMASAGMSPYDILASGSKSVGEYFSNEDDFGTIAVGSRADLLLLSENPLDDVKNLQSRVGVMARGQWLPEEAIQRRLDQIANTHDTEPVQ